jgi:glycosyltransferase involved in cell wall biosynthesis
MAALTGGPARIAVVVPTKDRPHKMRKLLHSLGEQEVECAQVVVVDSGDSIEGLISEYATRLPIEYHRSKPGQILQRNLGLRQIRPDVELVALLDDDIVFEKGALEAMLSAWRTLPPETAGVAFNIVNNPAIRRSYLGEFLGLSHRQPGQVLRSGLTTPNSPVDRDIRCQWLCGGATVWRREVLMERRHQEIPSRWAIAEDLIFSYPIGKRRPLFVCAASRVRHEHEAVPTTENLHRFHGRTQTKWTYYFVESNEDLSRLAFFWTLALRAVGRCGRSLWRRNNDGFMFALGQLEGGLAALAATVQGRDVVEIIRDEAGP